MFTYLGTVADRSICTFIVQHFYAHILPLIISIIGTITRHDCQNYIGKIRRSYKIFTANLYLVKKLLYITNNRHKQIKRIKDGPTEYWDLLLV